MWLAANFLWFAYLLACDYKLASRLAQLAIVLTTDPYLHPYTMPLIALIRTSVYKQTAIAANSEQISFTIAYSEVADPATDRKSCRLWLLRQALEEPTLSDAESPTCLLTTTIVSTSRAGPERLSPFACWRSVTRGTASETRATKMTQEPASRLFALLGHVCLVSGPRSTSDLGSAYQALALTNGGGGRARAVCKGFRVRRQEPIDPAAMTITTADSEIRESWIWTMATSRRHSPLPKGETLSSTVVSRSSERLRRQCKFQSSFCPEQQLVGITSGHQLAWNY